MMISFSIQSLARYQLILEYKLSNPNFLTFLQLSSFLFSSIYVVYRISKKQFELSRYYNVIFISILVTVAMILTNYSSFKLTESTQILFRSPRLIPIMISNIFIFQKSHSILVVLGICCMVCALVAFAIDEFSEVAHFDMRGIIATMFSICIDSFASNLEEKVLMEDDAGIYPTLCLVFGLSNIYMIIFNIFNGDFLNGLSIIHKYPECIPYVALFTLSGHFGFYILFNITKRYGCIAGCALVSIGKPIMSFIRQPKFTHMTFFSIILLSFGIMLNVISVSLGKSVDYVETKDQAAVAQFPLIAEEESADNDDDVDDGPLT
ncbi:hypothetical protein TVAG_222550 [Trichomonas vaginalis G3]|uniref:Uncharacterized protein n=1 Tax=Trichomonas vaginalis (strain ATCC PRA-98 / G3) TaxID=412133 RepID=A2F5D1_TRIV3|nr:3'-phosphoadenosine 5'-phosphosulfate transmembrane transporter protein [Trichomonas vaginalis G3]EAX99894.1 hypothetical protein TVAG_222550 [Trichomonas vaginalis G3]KAI5492926.1 3'-phosphoadenosine 5'-phosphosulfate transmembrane transporter protein [Trichomonas vaginalis G3]|eukprot:XP_001312824.1 hypothetical protein [Trichomonas vaginalis G3]